MSPAPAAPMPSMLPMTCGSIHWICGFRTMGCDPRTAVEFFRTRTETDTEQKQKAGCKAQFQIHGYLSPGSPHKNTPCAVLSPKLSTVLLLSTPSAWPLAAGPSAPLLRLPSSWAGALVTLPAHCLPRPWPFTQYTSFCSRSHRAVATGLPSP